jgi:hypothetical protein
MTLSEAFDNPLSYQRNIEEEKIYRKSFFDAGIRYFEIYTATLNSDEINFYLFLNSSGQYEIHFSNSNNDHEISPINGLNVYKNNQLTRIIATGIDIAIKKIEKKTTPFLIYGDTERKTKLYIRAIQTKIPNLITTEIGRVRGLDGNTYPYGVLLKQDTRTFKIENLLR